MAKDKKRIFIAAKISNQAKKELIRILDKLASLPFSIKWVKPKNFHLTLAFLGNVKEDKLTSLYQAVEESVSCSGSFSLKPDKLVCFPNSRHPRVIALNLEGGLGTLKKLQKGLKRNLGSRGFNASVKPAHLTLGRVRTKVKKRERIGLGRKINSFSFVFQKKIVINRIIVFQSTLFPQGPIYSPLKEFNLS